MGEAGPEGLRAGELVQFLAVGCLGWPQAVFQNARLLRGKTGRLTSPATTQAQNQAYELADSNIPLLVCELLEHMMGTNMQIQNCRISTTQDNRISKRGPSESPLSVA